ncbi:hypothetical protein HMPREF9630_00539 [Peptoanaerobacter stomatis]|uniref:Uncharacterized protein n=1 Tax=Peptoanaerobacter stomatis TaxID=796937 RepID=V9HVB4_9FIRM|nr:hypothetical protein [Peptoanaerobacter stomatis]EHL17372.1 hypothetical protein HMPREF9630_00539 [Peptoanaerobacter stomatis]
MKKFIHSFIHYILSFIKYEFDEMKNNNSYEKRFIEKTYKYF